MQVVTRGHQLFFQQEVQARKTGVQFSQGIHRFIHNRQTKRCFVHRRTIFSGTHFKQQICHFTRTILIRFGVHINLQIRGRVHHHQAGIQQDGAGAVQHISMYLKRAEQIRAEIHRQQRTAVFQFHTGGQHGLSFADDVNINTAARTGGEHGQVHRLAHPIYGVLRAQQDRISPTPC